MGLCQGKEVPIVPQDNSATAAASATASSAKAAPASPAAPANGDHPNLTPEEIKFWQKCPKNRLLFMIL